MLGEVCDGETDVDDRVNDAAEEGNVVPTPGVLVVRLLVVAAESVGLLTALVGVMVTPDGISDDELDSVVGMLGPAMVLLVLVDEAVVPDIIPDVADNPDDEGNDKEGIEDNRFVLAETVLDRPVVLPIELPVKVLIEVVVKIWLKLTPDVDKLWPLVEEDDKMFVRAEVILDSPVKLPNNPVNELWPLAEVATTGLVTDDKILDTPVKVMLKPGDD
ncbi:MAG: hypothetical protein Q9168_004818 [Polycauliona sp. 1 TL-2023]